MRLARITGNVTATVKADCLTGCSLLLADSVDAQGKLVDPGIVAVDTCGAGPGDLVLLAQGSAARQSKETSGLSVDATIIAVIDQVDVAAAKTQQSRGKK